MQDLAHVNGGGLIFAVLVGFGIAGCGEQAAYQQRVVMLSAESCFDVRFSGNVSATLNFDVSPQLVLTKSSEVPESVVELKTDGKLNVRSTVPVEVKLSCPEFGALQLLGDSRVKIDSSKPVYIQRIAAYGDAQIALQSLEMDELEVRASGDSQIALEQVSTDQLSMFVAGNAAVFVTGESSRTAIQASGGAELDAGGLRSQWVTITARGQAQIAVDASAHLAGELSGSAAVVYSGSPDLSINAKDAATLSAKD
ncbi:MAG: DUF2807 domain-containing protein [Pseudomonadota bacterium]